MRLLILITAVFIAGQAVAETEFTVKPDRIEMKKAIKDDGEDATEDKESAPATKAQDYNSSRSNTTSAAGPVDTDSNEDSDSDEDMEAVAPANHNTTRQR